MRDPRPRQTHRAAELALTQTKSGAEEAAAWGKQPCLKLLVRCELLTAAIIPTAGLRYGVCQSCPHCPLYISKVLPEPAVTAKARRASALPSQAPSPGSQWQETIATPSRRRHDTCLACPRQHGMPVATHGVRATSWVASSASPLV